MARLANDIRSGGRAPGARLPTEQALTTALGVSRTVVREAVAALRADGLVVTRRGSGAYVADPAAGPFRIAAPKAAVLNDVLEVMELRLAVEVEAAALAAERASRRQIGAIRTAWRALDPPLQRGRGGGPGGGARPPPPDRRDPHGLACHRPRPAKRRGRGGRGLRLPSRHRRGYGQPSIPALPRLLWQPCHSPQERAAFG